MIAKGSLHHDPYVSYMRQGRSSIVATGRHTVLWQDRELID